MTTAEINSQAFEISEKTSKLIAAHQLSPDPITYAVLFHYVSGTYPEMSAKLDLALAQHQTLKHDWLSEMHDYYIAGIRAEHFSRIGAELTTLTDHLLDDMQKAIDFNDKQGEQINQLTMPDKPITEAKVNLLLSELKKHVVGFKENEKKLQDKLIRTKTKMLTLEEELSLKAKEALTDSLTGHKNRRAFDQDIATALELDPNIGLLFIDVDHFKEVNDTYGHQLGDKILKLIADILSENLDGHGDLYRYGGDEFVLIIKALSQHEMKDLAEKLASAVREHQFKKRYSGEVLGNVTISVGLGFHQPGEEQIDFIHRADQALYEAKNKGRDRVVTARL